MVTIIGFVVVEFGFGATVLRVLCKGKRYIVAYTHPYPPYIRFIVVLGTTELVDLGASACAVAILT